MGNINTIIIAGRPGCGKTAIRAFLRLKLMELGFEVAPLDNSDMPPEVLHQLNTSPEFVLERLGGLKKVNPRIELKEAQVSRDAHRDDNRVIGRMT